MWRRLCLKWYISWSNFWPDFHFTLLQCKRELLTSSILECFFTEIVSKIRERIKIEDDATVFLPQFLSPLTLSCHLNHYCIVYLVFTYIKKQRTTFNLNLYSLTEISTIALILSNLFEQKMILEEKRNLSITQSNELRLRIFLSGICNWTWNVVVNKITRNLYLQQSL